jgi:hypothetical protein
LSAVLYPQKCPHCGFEWNSRLQNPRACPRCKRYLSLQKKPKLIVREVSVPNEGGIPLCKDCKTEVGVIQLESRSVRGLFCVNCALKHVAEIQQITHEEALDQLRALGMLTERSDSLSTVTSTVKETETVSDANVPPTVKEDGPSTVKEDIKDIPQTGASSGEFCIVLDCPDRPKHGFCVYAWYDSKGVLHCKKRAERQ